MNKNILFLIASLFLVSATSDHRSFDKIFDGNYGSVKGRGNGLCVIILKGTDTVYNRSQGEIDPDKVIPIASASKWLSAAVIMALVDEGKMSLDDSLGKFIPKISVEKSGLTIRRLFSHTSGLPGKNFFARGLRNRNESMKENAEEIDQRIKMNHRQGEAFEYGGVSMQLAARAAEIAGGMTFTDLLVKYVTGPLDMRHTAFKPLSSESSNPLVSGGIYSCASDYLHFLQMLSGHGIYKGKRVLSERSIHEMLKNQVPSTAKILKSPFNKSGNHLLKDEEARYGIGNWCEIYDPETGAAKLSSSPGLFGFTPWYDEEHGIIGVISVLSLCSKASALYVEMREEAQHGK